MAPPPRLLLITPPTMDVSRLRAVLPRLSSSVDAVLLRWPSSAARAVWEAACALAVVRPRPDLLVSDRADIARAAGLEGVHLKDGGIPATRIRRWGLQTIGASCHPARDFAAPPGADYVTASPVFATSSKPGARPLGVENLAAFCAASQTPVLALGGIDASRVRACLDAGAHGVAVLSAVWDAEDPAAAADAIRRALDDL